MNLVIVNSAGLATIALIVWWFWMSKPRARSESGTKPIEIVVDQGVYTPSRIEVPVGARLYYALFVRIQAPVLKRCYLMISTSPLNCQLARPPM